MTTEQLLERVRRAIASTLTHEACETDGEGVVCSYCYKFGWGDVQPEDHEPKCEGMKLLQSLDEAIGLIK